MDAKPNSVKRITQRHQAMFDQWEQERKDFVAKHGREAWDAKVDREIQELYPEDKPWTPCQAARPLCQSADPGEKTKL